MHARGSTADHSPRSDAYEGLVATLAGEVNPGRVRAVWDAGVAAAGPEGPPVWLHADLHPANVLVENGNLVGIIDFGDMCAGDRANDQAPAWVLLPDGAARGFLEEYGAVDIDTERRARAWAVLLAMLLLDTCVAGQGGEPGGKPTWTEPARSMLRRIIDS